MVLNSCEVYKKKKCVNKILIINNSEFLFSNINCYSTRLENIKSKDSLSFNKLNYNIDTDNSMLSLSVKNKTFIIYLKQLECNKNFTIQIDSLNLKNQFIYSKNENNWLTISTFYDYTFLI